MSLKNNQEFRSAIDAILPQVRELRREFHRHPEIRFQEHTTSDLLLQKMRGSGIPAEKGWCGGTGVVGNIGRTGDDIIALRADMDALEIAEKTGAAYASATPSCMHACGHDGHMAMLWGAAHILAQYQAHLKCGVRFIFQPAEEMGNGGKRMVDEGVLDGVASVFGMHGWPDLPLGKLALKSGYAMAGADWFKITIHGKGCHAAAPASGIDPIIAVAHVILGLQTIVSQELDPCIPAIVSIGRVQAGGLENSIPETAEITGTFRTLTPESRDLVREAITHKAKTIAEAHRTRAVVEFTGSSYVPLYNDPEECTFAQNAINSFMGEGVFMEAERPSMASEDFAFYLRKTPGAFLWLGTQPPGAVSPGLHSPYYDFNDDALIYGISVWLSLVAAFNDRCTG